MRTIEVPKAGTVYVLQMGITPYYKIGCSSDLEKRLSQLGVNSPYPLSLQAEIPSEDMYATERELHARYASKRVRGEWFKLDNEDLKKLCEDALVATFTLYVDALYVEFGGNGRKVARHAKAFLAEIWETVVLPRAKAQTFNGSEWNPS